MSIKPLYLEAGTGWQVQLDGPSLRVQGGVRAPGRYPLSRLSRVVSASDVAWSTEALLACLKAGVPVVFRDHRGVAQGWCFGARRRETTLCSLLREAVAQPDWDARFADWRAGMVTQEAYRALHACGLPATERAEPRSYESCLFNAHHERFGDGTALRITMVKGCLSALVAERLHDAIGDPELIAWARPGLHLTAEFSALLAWDAHAALYGMRVADVRGVAAGKVAARLLEARGDRLAAALGRLLGAFELWLREWLL